jgi:HEPN domain-containing protein
MTPALEEAQKLLRVAKADREVFAYLKPAAHLRDAIVLFHAQQAIEKAIKAILTAHGIPFGRTHNLLALAALLAENGIAWFCYLGVLECDNKRPDPVVLT